MISLDRYHHEFSSDYDYYLDYNVKQIKYMYLLLFVSSIIITMYTIISLHLENSKFEIIKNITVIIIINIIVIINIFSRLYRYKRYGTIFIYGYTTTYSAIYSDELMVGQ